MQAQASGLDLEPEDAEVSDGLAEASTNGDAPPRGPRPEGAPWPRPGSPTRAAARAYSTPTGGCSSSASSSRRCTGCSSRARSTARPTSPPARRPSPVGVCSALDPGDYVAGTYRGHGHALAKGTDPDALIAEMLGRATGVCGGRSGSMNVIDLEHGLVGCYGIVGGSIAAATGAALSAKRQGRVAAAFLAIR